MTIFRIYPDIEKSHPLLPLAELGFLDLKIFFRKIAHSKISKTKLNQILK